MKYYILLIFLLFVSMPVSANGLPDSDRDGIPDFDEINIYKTDPNNKDTDNDGYSDWVELNMGFSPHNNKPIKLENNDLDNDGLSDRMELNFFTNLSLADSDNDGYNDGAEIEQGYNPLDASPTQLSKRIEINLNKQKLSYFLAGVKLKEYKISSGINKSTPIGHYKITNKILKAWSPYGLWMPFWLGLNDGRIGIHELPVWPNGYREGEDHLGTPVSHGCIRLGIDSAEYVYNRVEVGTDVFIY